jgi:hypothetical protein
MLEGYPKKLRCDKTPYILLFLINGVSRVWGKLSIELLGKI